MRRISAFTFVKMPLIRPYLQFELHVKEAQNNDTANGSADG